VKKSAAFLPHWIRHHAHMFDSVTMLDVGSTDGSVAVALDEAPAHWTLHAAPSAFLGKNTSGYAACAEEQAALRPHRATPEALAAVCASLGWRQGTALMELEAGDAIAAEEAAAPPGAWRVTLEASEFLVAPSLRTLLESAPPRSAASANLEADGEVQAPAAAALRLPGFAVHCAGRVAPPLERVTSPLLHCPHVWVAEGGMETGPSRLMQRTGSSSSSSSHNSAIESFGAFVARFSPPQLGNLSSSFRSSSSVLPPVVSLDLRAIFPRTPLAQTLAVRSAAAAWRGTFSAETKLDYGGDMHVVEK
jgi:hypothetical protein